MGLSTDRRTGRRGEGSLTVRLKWSVPVCGTAGRAGSDPDQSMFGCNDGGSPPPILRFGVDNRAWRLFVWETRKRVFLFVSSGIFSGLATEVTKVH